jgi:hypothetical protein
LIYIRKNKAYNQNKFGFLARFLTSKVFCKNIILINQELNIGEKIIVKNKTYDYLSNYKIFSSFFDFLPIFLIYAD